MALVGSFRLVSLELDSGRRLGLEEAGRNPAVVSAGANLCPVFLAREDLDRVTGLDRSKVAVPSRRSSTCEVNLSRTPSCWQ